MGPVIPRPRVVSAMSINGAGISVPSGIPEIDAVAERLNASSGQLAELLRREREFSALSARCG